MKLLFAITALAVCFAAFMTVKAYAKRQPPLNETERLYKLLEKIESYGAGDNK